jgi:hypothetical protein
MIPKYGDPMEANLAPLPAGVVRGTAFWPGAEGIGSPFKVVRSGPGKISGDRLY